MGSDQRDEQGSWVRIDEEEQRNLAVYVIAGITPQIVAAQHPS